MLNELQIIATWIVGLLLAIGALGVAWWAIFGDRSRGRRRCPRCWHDLSHTPGLTCGECGHAARRESSLYRTRRRWLVAGLATLALFGPATVIRFRAQDASWLDLMPDRVLVALIPVLPGDQRAVRDHLAIELNFGRMSEETADALFRRCVRGDAWAPPLSDAWRRKYGALLSWWRRNGQATDVQRELLHTIPASIEIAGPPGVTSDLPLCLYLDIEHWWPFDTECRITLTPIGAFADSAPPLRVVRQLVGNRVPPFPFEMQPLPPGTTHVPMRLELERRQRLPTVDGDDRHTVWRSVRQSDVEIPVAMIEGSAERLLTPTDNEAMREVIRTALGEGLSRWERGERRFGIRFDPRRTRVDAFDGVAVGLMVEILEGDAVRRRTRLWWMGGDPGGPYGYGISDEDEVALDRAVDGDPTWTMRVRGDAELALRAVTRLGAPPNGWPVSYWAGEVTLPLPVQDRYGTAPTRPWRVDDEVETLAGDAPVDAPSEG